MVTHRIDFHSECCPVRNQQRSTPRRRRGIHDGADRRFDHYAQVVGLRGARVPADDRAASLGRHGLYES